MLRTKINTKYLGKQIFFRPGLLLGTKHIFNFFYFLNVAELHLFAFSLSSNMQIGALNQMQATKSLTHNLDPFLINLGNHESHLRLSGYTVHVFKFQLMLYLSHQTSLEPESC